MNDTSKPLVYSKHLVKRLSDPNDPLTKISGTVNKVTSTALIISGIGISFFSLKAATGLCVAGIVALTANRMHQNHIKK
jgi:hypothetical protein